MGVLLFKGTTAPTTIDGVAGVVLITMGYRCVRRRVWFFAANQRRRLWLNVGQAGF